MDIFVVFMVVFMIVRRQKARFRRFRERILFCEESHIISCMTCYEMMHRRWIRELNRWWSAVEGNLP